MLTKRIPPVWVILCLACLLPTSAARAGETKGKKRKPPAAAGSIEVSTSPRSYPIRIDGREAERTAAPVSRFSLPPGPHTVEILLPHDERWAQTVNVVSGRRSCITLSRAPQRIGPEAPAEDVGNTTATVCDCGKALPDFFSVKAGGGGLPKAPNLFKKVLKKNSQKK